MDLGEFKLSNLSYELRYAPAFKLMDRIGAIAAEFVDQWPDLRVVEQNRSMVKLRGAHMEASVGVERSHIIHAGFNLSTTLQIEQSALLTSSLAEFGRIATFTRVGVRQQYNRRYPTLDEAVDAFYGTKVLPRPPLKNFGVEGKAHFADFAQRVEGETLGWLAKFVAQTATYTTQPAFGDDSPKVERVENELVFDLDYFTTKDVDVGQIAPAEWIGQALRFARRDAAKVLGG